MSETVYGTITIEMKIPSDQAPDTIEECDPFDNYLLDLEVALEGLLNGHERPGKVRFVLRE